MRIVVMGAGAMGGYFGAKLAAAGYDVGFIARGAHLAAMQDRGLRVISPHGDFELPSVTASDNPADLGTADVVLFTVKNYDVETAAHAIKPLIGPQTMVVTCQNGVSTPERLAAVVGAEKVVPGVAKIPGEVPEPGVIHHTTPNDALIFGEVDGTLSDRCKAFEDALAKAGTSPTATDSILYELWWKMVFQSALSGMTTVTRLNIGPLRDHPATRQLFYDAMQEAGRVARAVVPDLPGDIADQGWNFMLTIPGHMHASMLDDLRNGKRIEVDYLSGEIVRLGKKHGVETPIHGFLSTALQPFVNGAPG